MATVGSSALQVFAWSNFHKMSSDSSEDGRRRTPEHLRETKRPKRSEIDQESAATLAAKGPRQPSTWDCPNCGAASVPAAAFCHQCGEHCRVQIPLDTSKRIAPNAPGSSSTQVGASSANRHASRRPSSRVAASSARNRSAERQAARRMRMNQLCSCEQPLCQNP